MSRALLAIAGILATGLGLAWSAGIVPGLGTHTAGEVGPPERAVVTGIIDGDTIRVQDRSGTPLGRVRLLGVDAPEIAHPPASAECYAAAATRLLEDLVPVGSIVTLSADTAQPDRDQYGRLLRYVDRAGADASAALLDAGAARRFDSSPPLARDRAYRTALEDAQKAERGIWGNC